MRVHKLRPSIHCDIARIAEFRNSNYRRCLDGYSHLYIGPVHNRIQSSLVDIDKCPSSDNKVDYEVIIDHIILSLLNYTEDKWKYLNIPENT